jgi:hypothetical protein
MRLSKKTSLYFIVTFIFRKRCLQIYPLSMRTLLTRLTLIDYKICARNDHKDLTINSVRGRNFLRTATSFKEETSIISIEYPT